MSHQHMYNPRQVTPHVMYELVWGVVSQNFDKRGLSSHYVTPSFLVLWLVTGILCALITVSARSPKSRISNDSVCKMPPFPCTSALPLSVKYLKSANMRHKRRQLGSRWRARRSSVSGRCFCPVLKVYTRSSCSSVPSFSWSLCLSWNSNMLLCRTSYPELPPSKEYLTGGGNSDRRA